MTSLQQNFVDFHPPEATLAIMPVPHSFPASSGQATSSYGIQFWVDAPRGRSSHLITGSHLDNLRIGDSGSTTSSTDFLENRAKQDYYIVVSRVLDLLVEEEMDEDYGGEVLPTKYALNRTLEILSNTYEVLRTTFPKAAASTSFDGGIRVQWMYPRFSVRLVIPGTPAQDEYIFFEDEETYGSEKVSVETLATKLMWLERVLRHVEIA